MCKKQSGSESLYVSSEKDITPQKQLGISFPGTQAQYFWQPVFDKLRFHVFLYFHARNYMTS